MDPAAREQMIVDEATRYFAEHGLTGGTSELARRIGITQPLLYRYFSTKDALIERVFEGLFPQVKSAEWEALIGDRSIPLRDRLKTFYREFTETVFTYEHVRLHLFSGLSKLEYNTRYYDLVTEKFFLRIAHALREETAVSNGATFPNEVGEEELELVQTLHSSIYHISFRRWVHTPGLEGDINHIIEYKVDSFLDGAMTTLNRLSNS
jgi:AcrR family transcriptional regulator